MVEAEVLADAKPWTAAYLRLAVACEVVVAARAFQVKQAFCFKSCSLVFPDSPPPRSQVSHIVFCMRRQIIMASIVFLAALLVGVQTQFAGPGNLGNHPLIETLSQFSIAMFTLEVGLKIVAEGRHPERFFVDGWNRFDFGVVLACLVFLLPDLPKVSSLMSMVRLLRLLRVIKLIRIFPEMRVIVEVPKRYRKSIFIQGRLILSVVNARPFYTDLNQYFSLVFFYLCSFLCMRSSV